MRALGKQWAVISGGKTLFTWILICRTCASETCFPHKKKKKTMASFVLIKCPKNNILIYILLTRSSSCHSTYDSCLSGAGVEISVDGGGQPNNQSYLLFQLVYWWLTWWWWWWQSRSNPQPSVYCFTALWSNINKFILPYSCFPSPGLVVVEA